MVISMPGNEEIEDTAERMLEKYRLSRFPYIVEGCQIRFSEALRRIPYNKKNLWGGWGVGGGYFYSTKI